MPASSNPKIRKRKQRVDVACDFCRHRKLGCDNAKPRCTNCCHYHKDCQYAVQPRKDLPSGSELDRLRQEDSRLRQESERLHSALSGGQLLTSDESTQSSNSGSPSMITSHGPMSGIHESLPLAAEPSAPPGVEITDEAQFHGPTSAMFDGDLPRKTLNTNPNVTIDGTQRMQLLAEAAKQRQLELINLRAGKLDFDGLDPDTGMLFLSIFWNRQHATGSAVYRPAFMRDMTCQGPYFSKLLLNAIMFVASKYKPLVDIENPGHNDVCRTGYHFRSRVEKILYHSETQALCKSSVVTIQALLIMSDALFSWCDERSLSWHYLGIACNMIIDLGIHAENNTAPRKNVSAESREIHRRVFWSAFVLDKIQSIYQGRPSHLRDMDCNVPIEFYDEYEELEPFNPVGYNVEAGSGHPTHSVSSFEQLCKLSVIADHILYGLYSLKSSDKEPEELLRISRNLNNELLGWRESLPAHLTTDPLASRTNTTLPHILCLTLLHHSLLILLHRPFVSEGHLKPAASLATSDAFSICETVALDIDGLLRLYRAQWCIKSPPYFLSYATYVSATIHVRTAARQAKGSRAHECLRNCLEILSEHQDVCHAPRRAMGILLGLVRRLMVDVGDVFAASVSRMARCEASRSKDVTGTVKPTDIVSNSLSVMQTSSLETNLTSNNTDVSLAVGVPGFSLPGYDEDGQPMDWISFEFDPLFGIDSIGSDWGMDLSQFGSF